MLTRTHLAITLFFVLIFISYIENKAVFVVVAFLATLIPDIDSKYSKSGNKKTFRLLQFFVNHRGFFHSYIFLLLITLFFALFIPVLAFAFFLGYSVHLFTDSFTKKGIQPFYPYKKTLSGSIRTGGRIEIIVFTFFVLADLFLIAFKILAMV